MLVSVNCAAFPAELVESELLVTKSAFTGLKIEAQIGLIRLLIVHFILD